MIQFKIFTAIKLSVPTGERGRKAGRVQKIQHTFKVEKSFAGEKSKKTSKQDILLWAKNWTMREKRIHPVLKLGTDPHCIVEYREEL
jgi:hypothetical protein